MSEIRKFETGATRNGDLAKLDYDGFLSPLVLERYDDYVYRERDVAWAAGLFEGEGSVTTYTVKGRERKDGTGGDRRYVYPRLRLNNTDEDTIRRFAAIVGGKILGPYPPRGPLSKKPWWAWQVSGEEAIAAAKSLFPYFSRRRTDRLFEVFGLLRAAEISGIAPDVLDAFGRFMHKNRHMEDGSLRASDNWKLGIPRAQYMKSLWRHMLEVWRIHNARNPGTLRT